MRSVNEDRLQKTLEYILEYQKRESKPKTQIYEVMTLDMFLSMVYQTLERKYYDESF